MSSFCWRIKKMPFTHNLQANLKRARVCGGLTLESGLTIPSIPQKNSVVKYQLSYSFVMYIYRILSVGAARKVF